MRIVAEIGDYAYLQSQHRAVFLERHLGSHRLVAALNRRDENIAAGRDPFDRAAQLERHIASQDVFAIKRPFAAESAADIRGDQPDFVFRNADRASKVGARPVRALGGKPDRQALAHRVRIGGDAARFDGQGNLTRADNVHTDEVIRLREGFIDIAALFHCRIADIAVQLFTSQGRARLERILGVLDRRQRLIFDLDGVARVLGNRPALRDHCSDRCTRGVNGAAREHRMRGIF